MIPKRYLAGALVAALTAGGALASRAQPAVQVQGAPPYTLLSREGRRPLVARRVNGQDMFTLDELASIFDLSVREDAMAGGLTISAGRQTIVLSGGQTLASVGGRLISLPSPAVRDGRTWLVPVEFVSRAVGPAVRRPRRAPQDVPSRHRRRPAACRASALRLDAEGGDRARLTFEVDPATGHRVSGQAGRLVVAFDADAIDPRLGTVPAGPLVAAVRAADEPAVDRGGPRPRVRVLPRGGRRGRRRGRALRDRARGRGRRRPVPPVPAPPARCRA